MQSDTCVEKCALIVNALSIRLFLGRSRAPVPTSSLTAQASRSMHCSHVAHILALTCILLVQPVVGLDDEPYAMAHVPARQRPQLWKRYSLPASL